PGTTYAILSASGGFTGSFTSVTDNIPNTTAVLFDDAFQNVFLELLAGQTDYTASAQTFNQRSAATALDSISFGSSGPLGLAIVQLNALNPDQLRFTLDQLGGEVYASSITTGIENHALFLRTLGERARPSACCPEACDCCLEADGSL